MSTRLTAITESATLAVDAKAKALNAKGERVIGFGAGEPDFPTPERIGEAAVKAARNPKYHHYTPTAGLPDLREAFAALCNPGDEVICPAPYWTTYPESILLAGGVPIFVDTTEETEFKVTVDQLERSRTPRTKVLLFVSPNNPSGTVYSPQETIDIGHLPTVSGW